MIKNRGSATRFAFALILATVGLFPSDEARASNVDASGGTTMCSTCTSDLVRHTMNNDCCESGGGCYEVSSYGSHTTGGWCSDAHNGCDAT